MSGIAGCSQGFHKFSKKSVQLHSHDVKWFRCSVLVAIVCACARARVACVVKVQCTFPSTGSPSDEELLDLADRIPGEWYPLSIRLGLTAHAADNIVHNVHYAQPRDKAFRALVDWRNRFDGSATYEKLADALRKIGRRDLVQEFCTDQVNIWTVSRYRQRVASNTPRRKKVVAFSASTEREGSRVAKAIVKLNLAGKSFQVFWKFIFY